MDVLDAIAVNEKNSNGDTALHYIFYDQCGINIKKLELLLKHGADPLEKNAAEITPFYYMLKSLQKGKWFSNLAFDPVIMRLMINYSKDLDINQKDNNGDTPLTLIAESNKRQHLIEVLLANGADINAANRDGQTALHLACLTTTNESRSTVKLLLEKGAKIQLNSSGAYPYFLAHTVNDFKIFIKHGTDMNTQNDNGDTALHYIIKQTSKDYDLSRTVTVLLTSTKTLDLTLMNKDGKTVYDLLPECADPKSRGSSYVQKFDKYKEAQSKLKEKTKSKTSKDAKPSMKSTKSASLATCTNATKPKSTKSTPAPASTNTTNSSSSTEVKKKTANVPGTSSSASSLKSSEPLTILKTSAKSAEKGNESKSSGSNANQIESVPEKNQKESMEPEKQSTPSSEDDAQKDHKDVMISYQWDNQKTAVKLRDYLVKNGKLNVWMDVTDMSEDMNEAMARGVAYSSIFVMCMSQKYAESVNCKKEYSYADRLRKHIIPVKVQSDFSPTLGTALDLIVGANIYYDLDADFNNQTKKLMNDINNYLNRKQ